MMNSESNIPIACQLNVFDQEQRRRYKELSENLMKSVEQIHEDVDGYSMEFSNDSHHLTTIAEWITFERMCCPFLQFSIDVKPASGPILLKLGSGHEIKEFLKQEFTNLRKNKI